MRPYKRMLIRHSGFYNERSDYSFILLFYSDTPSQFVSPQFYYCTSTCEK